MTFTEEDLRAALSEGVRADHPDVPGIVRRGRRIRRRRTAGVALAVTAVAVAAVLLAGPGANLATLDQGPVTQATHATIAPPGGLPPRNEVDAPLIKTAVFDTMVTGATITFRPVSPFTSLTVVCADPRAWVAVTSPNGGAGLTRCSPGGFTTMFDRLSIVDDWLTRPQRMHVWVFPADTPIAEGRRGRAGSSYDGCVVADESTGRCDGEYLPAVLLKPGYLEKLAAELGPRPGRWAIGIYDRADLDAPAFPTPTTTVTPSVRKGTERSTPGTRP
ncbi:hypothetical protein Sme01_43180 [Sphaerisporangium melleum]|uniref:Uncharacterized protein n=1 Tax=Sphaerisporangium melleum TaxID=321316 RepID=A0A917QZK7_9ACTN|nr:hypothetical protein [Sphaerisporangium melleum]GGK77377.1 hypothetical protein GCM10007964_20140 [Sphaerisporangium melleum]GII71842.1 hypothetical protein Sme01_43180 [Sphaerisporangium melleum]